MGRLAPVQAAGPAPRTVELISTYDQLALLALLRSRYTHLPLSPTRVMSATLLNRLAERLIIELPWPDDRWVVRSKRQYTVGEEMLDWRYSWPAYDDLDALEQLLVEAIEAGSVHDEGPDGRLDLWADLAFAEVVSYARHRLEKSGLDPEWALDVEWLRREIGRHSLSRWRYAVWAAVRAGCSASATGRTASHTRAAIRHEYEKRLVIAANVPGFGNFVPEGSPRPYSILGRVLVEHALPIADAYWTVVPSKWTSETLGL